MTSSIEMGKIRKLAIFIMASDHLMFDDDDDNEDEEDSNKLIFIYLI